MKWTGYILLSMLFIVTVIAINHPAALARSLDTEGAEVSEITGTFTLILYGGGFLNDVETIAFLDPEGDGYTLEPYAPKFDYRVEKGLSAKDALAKAEHFVSGHYEYWHSQLSRILDEQGKTIGFEVRPLYYPYVFGFPDVFYIYYVAKGDKVIIYIDLEESVKRQLFFGDGSKGGSSGN